jgi:dihydropteroate synthase
MGVLNVTPDSFSDGGIFSGVGAAVKRAVAMERDGADIIDVGGESTRPGAGSVDAGEEISRVIPVIKKLSGRIKIPISVDTQKAVVAAKALESGAVMVNDVSGLRHDPMMARVIARYGAAVIIMHMKGSPLNMQKRPFYRDLIGELTAYFKKCIAVARFAGIPEDDIIVDPGIGFGKTVEHNLEILRRLGEFKVLGKTICVGTSRKSFIGKILGIEDPMRRINGTIASAVAAIMNGADILRVHDVRQIKEASIMADRIMGRGNGK